MMLAAKCHLGTKNCDFQMERYVSSRQPNGIFVINLGKTWDKLVLAARVIAAIENPQDVAVLSARTYGQRAVLKFSQYTGCKALAGRHTPGTFTNQIQKMYEEPRLLILTDPRQDHQPIKEASYVNVPTVAFCDTDSPLQYVDIAIPANNKAKHAIGCLCYILARMVLNMRGTLPYGQPWDVQVDLFFYREPEEVKEEDEGAEVIPGYGEGGEFSAAATLEYPAADFSSAAPAADDGGWGAGDPAVGGFEAVAAPAIDYPAAATADAFAAGY